MTSVSSSHTRWPSGRCHPDEHCSAPWPGADRRRGYSLRGSLFGKSFLALFLAVVVPLTASGLGEAWFGYWAQRDRLDQLLGVEARAAAFRIQGFIDTITGQLGWLVQLPWSEEVDERRRIDALRLLRQVPAVSNVTLIDGQGRERLHVSRIGLNRLEARTDRQADPGVEGARARGIWFSEITHVRGSEPYVTVAFAGSRPSVGIVLAEVNLKLIWDVIAGIRIGGTGHAYLLDGPGRLIAHPDISLVLRGADDATLRPFRAIRAAVAVAEGRTAFGQNADGGAVIAAASAVPGVDWTVLVEQPLAEAFRPIHAALLRTAGIFVGGSLVAALLAYWLARRMTGPIRLLQQGTERIRMGQFEHRISLRTGDELQRLAESFNSMAAGLAESQERQERIAKLKRFLAPQVAELVERAGGDDMLEGRRVEVVAIFGDLRGFTAFSANAEPDAVMRVLAEYHEAVGAIVTARQATLTSFAGDGLMILVNAPVPVPDPVDQALDMARDIQCAVRELVVTWQQRGHRIGHGMGLALGPATVGRIGYEGRHDYAAIGCVTNLAARLCAAARDGEILVDAAAAAAARQQRSIIPLGFRAMKGYEGEVPIFGLDLSPAPEQPARPARASYSMITSAPEIIEGGTTRPS
ncbi:MAG TPA: adenylate/guanylate cyclase domain-containing protein [Microvirga sp.]|jgi:class 3 adenylate cyclase